MKPIPWRVALRDSELDSTAKLVGLVLSTYMNGRGDCWPKKLTIAERTGLSKRAVDGAIQRLEAGDFLRVEPSKKHPYHRRPNKYFAVVPKGCSTYTLSKGASNDANKGAEAAPEVG